jgi:hypothetical protein
MDPEDISDTSIERTRRVEKLFKPLAGDARDHGASAGGWPELEAPFEDNDFKYSTKL